MKNLAITILTAAAVTSGAQVCQSYNFGKDQKLYFETRSYPLTFESDMSMITGDTKYKTKNSVSFNQKIAAGKIAPKSVEQSTLTYQRAEDMKDFRFYEAVILGMKTPVNLQYYCIKDTLASLLYFGHIAYVVKNDTLGTFLYGMNYYPTNAKVGDRIKGSSNISLITADTKQIDRVRKLFYTEYNAFEISPARHYATTTNLTGPIDGTSFGITLAQPGLVLREEKITIDSKEYTAKVIGTESWMKTMIGKMETDFYELEQKYLQTPDMSKPILKTPSFEAGGKRAWDKKDGEMLDVNKYGFSMSYREEWLVSGLGIVKTISYDGNGAILSTSELKRIE